MKRNNFIFSFIFILLLIITKVSSVYGSGFAIYTQGASSLGQSAATIAHTEDASAIFFNPALINKLDKNQFLISTTLIFPSREFVSDTSGRKYKEKTNLHYPSNFYATYKINNIVTTGIGIFNPFGLGTEWPDDWEGRYIATKSEMKTYNINPVLSFQITPNIALAGGVNILFLDSVMERKLNFSLFGLSDGNQKFKGDGTGYGFNLGFIFDLNKDISIGASYRSKIKVDIDGKMEHDLPNPLFISNFPNTNGSVKLHLPAQFHLGVFYKGLEPFSFEIATRWEGWSSYKELNINLDQPILGLTTLTMPKNWKDTYSIIFGAKYKISDYLSLLAGYLYSGNPVPDSTFEPSIPDANTHLFTIGLSYKRKNVNFDIAYAFQKLQNRKKVNLIDDNPLDPLNPESSANGTYKSQLNMIGLSFTYKF